MSSNRLVYLNWISDLGLCPGAIQTSSIQESSPRMERIKEAVQQALTRLSDEEHEFIVHFHYMGESYVTIADRTGRQVHRLESLHKRAQKKLRAALAPVVEEVFGFNATTTNSCPLCASQFRSEIDRIIANRDPRCTWKPVIRALRSEFGLKVASPQTLIGHERYHLNAGNREEPQDESSPR